jgi:hypothetical protein
MKKDLVMTAALNYSYGKLEPLIRTLRGSGFDGDVVFFYDNLSSKTLKLLKKWDIILIKIPSDKLKKEGSILVNYRFSFYYDYLKDKLDKYRLVFLIDSRDVVFQQNPSLYKNFGELNFFQESKKVKESESNSISFKALWGKKIFDKYKENYIACAGTTIGESKYILGYLDKMIKNIKYWDKPYDQPLHYYLIYSGAFPISKKFKNLHGPVLTVGNSENKELIYDKKGNLINKDGSIIPILHQYDRKTSLLFKFNNPLNFVMRYSEFKYINFKRFAKRILFKIPFVGASLKGKYNDPLMQAKS